MERATLKIKANTDNVVKFLYDTPIEGTNSYGVYHLYAFDMDGTETGLFATDALHEKLKNFTIGDSVNIRKEEYEPNKFGWNVIPEEGTPARNTGTPSNINDSYKSTPSATTQERTKDIHRQVCLKLAVQSMGTPETLDLAIVKQRMEGLLDVLDGKETDSLPF
jgi:hypothetical protein|tara:strand:+ start:5915 stop:6406 length:492 start_codon:yes stop_codon:yes gene_type:complete